jgi:hypothetical protein
MIQKKFFLKRAYFFLPFPSILFRIVSVMQMNLGKLPHHVLLHIFHHLSSQGDYKTIVSLSQTCQPLREIYITSFQKLAKHHHALHRISHTICLCIETDINIFSLYRCIDILFNAHRIRLKIRNRNAIQLETNQWFLEHGQQIAFMEIDCEVDGTSSLCLTNFVELAHALRPVTQNQPMLKAIQEGQQVYKPCEFSICGLGSDFGLTENAMYCGPIPRVYPRVYQIYDLIKTVITEESIHEKQIMFRQTLGSVQYIACA